MKELHKIDQPHEKNSKKENDKLIWSSQHKNLNLLCGLPSDIRRNGNVRNFWDGNGEEGIQPVKQEFVTKKGDFSGQIMKKTFTKKVMTRLNKDINYGCNTDHDVSNYFTKSKGCLQGMMKQRTPCHNILSNTMSFVNTSNKKSKPKPTLHKCALNSHDVKLKHSLSERKFKCKVGNCHLDDKNEIICEDGNK